ncbi:MAG: citramalate synthase [Candidatus Brocadiia bacterium]
MNEEGRDIFLYDTTLRDGCQAEGMTLSAEDKLEITERLDELGVHYVEGGFAGANPKDDQYFREVQDLDLRNVRIAAFGATRRKGRKPEDDAGLQALLRAETPVVTIVAKAWDYHVTEVLHTDLEENLRMVDDSVRFLKETGREVLVDAEHWFDGYEDDPDYAMKVARVAAEAGADCVVLCDTNGGALTDRVGELTARAVEEIDCPVGIHCHNDCGLAVANTIASVQHGAVHVQGTLNGFGERAGNADLCAIIPIINLKTPHRCVSDEQLKKLTEVSRFAYEAANLMFDEHQPFVGPSAFAHKAGQHVDAMRKAEAACEHIDPELVGNERRFLLSELSGHAGMLAKLEDYSIESDRETASLLLDRLKELENEGYQYEAAEASFELLATRITGNFVPRFDVKSYHVSCIRQPDGALVTDATVKLDVNGDQMHTASEGDGPVNALDGALRKALEPHYPELARMRLTDYRVRVINPRAATAARVRVVIQSTDGKRVWGTVGVSENIIDASWEALKDSVEYMLLMSE